MTEEHQHPFAWNFGDGSPVSHDENPTHIFEKPGTYTVTLTVAGPGGSNAATSNVSVRERAAQPPGVPETIPEKIRRYFPWRGDGRGLRCEACCTLDYEYKGDEWIGNFLMLYPNCIGYYDPKTGWTCHDPDHLCYVYPVGFCYPLLMFFGGGTTETAEYPKLWEGTLKINGERFDLSNPADFWVNKNGVGIVPPQQYGVCYEGRYWSFANGHRLVEHLPDVAIFPNYDIGEPSNAYKHANAGIWIEYRHPDKIPSYDLRTNGISTVRNGNVRVPDSVLSPNNCEAWGISSAELADPEIVLERCFCCGRGFPLDWIPRRNSRRRRRAAWAALERPFTL